METSEDVVGCVLPQHMVVILMDNGHLEVIGGSMVGSILSATGFDIPRRK